MAIFNQILSKRKIVKPCDYGNLLKTIASGETWTATKDGWLYVLERGDNGYDSEVYINGELIFDLYSSTGEPREVFVYIKKGTTIFLKNFRVSSGKFYGCIK